MTKEITPEEFQAAIKAYLDIARMTAENPERALAGHFEVAPSTVLRWANGVSKPHPVIRLHILNWIEQQT